MTIGFRENFSDIPRIRDFQTKPHIEIERVKRLFRDHDHYPNIDRSNTGVVKSRMSFVEHNRTTVMFVWIFSYVGNETADVYAKNSHISLLILTNPNPFSK